MVRAGGGLPDSENTMNSRSARLRRTLLLLLCAPLFTACCFGYGYGYGCGHPCGNHYNACHSSPRCR